MKLLDKHRNDRTNTDIYLYKLNNGIKLIHVENPATLDSSLSLIVKSGSIYEDQENVPHGTAHLLEHMFFKPNSKFETDEEIHTFEEGTRHKPTMYINANTDFKTICFFGFVNQKGEKRMLERISSLIDFPYDIFQKSFETERNIVLAERSRLLKEKKDKTIQLLKFLQGEILPEFSYAVVGEIEDIKKITLKDLLSFFNSRFVKDNALIAIQTSTTLRKQTINQLEKLGNRFGDGVGKYFNNVTSKNELDLGIFKDDRMEGTSIFLEYFLEKPKGFNYNDEVTYNITNQLIRKVGEEILRDKLGLVYAVETYKNAGLTLNAYLYEIKFNTENHKTQNLIEEINNFLTKYLLDFLTSKRGKNWFESEISKFIFPHTPNFDVDLAEDIAYSYIEREDLWDPNAFYKEAKSLKIENIIEAIKALSCTPPHIWIEGNQKKNTIEDIVRNSSLWKRFF